MIPITGIGKNRDKSFSLVFGPLGYLQGGCHRSATANPASNPLLLMKSASHFNGFIVVDCHDFVNAAHFQQQLYDYNLNKAHAAYNQNDTVKTIALLDDCLSQQRGWEWHHLRRLAHDADVTMEYEFSGPPARLFCLSPDGSRLAIGDEDGTLRLLDATSGEEVWAQPTGNRFIFWITFSSNGEFVAVTHINSKDPHEPRRGGLQVWDTKSATKVWEAGGGEEPLMFGFTQFSPDGRQLVVSGGSGFPPEPFVQLRDAKTGEQNWSAPAPGFATFAFSPREERLFLSIWSVPFMDYSSTLCCWNVEDHTELWSVQRSTSSLVAVNRDGTRLVTGGPNHSLQIWDARTGKQLDELHAHHPDIAGSVFFSHNGQWLVSSDKSGFTVLWDWKKRNVRRSTRHHERTDTSPRPLVRFTTFCADDQYLVSLDATPGNKIQFRTVDPAPREWTLSGHEGTVREVVFHPNGEQLLSAGHDGTLRVWDVRTGQERRTTRADTKVRTLACTANHIATGGGDGVKVWDFNSGEQLHHWPDTELTWYVRFSPDGRQLVAAGEGGLKVWNVFGGEELWSLEYAKDQRNWMAVAIAGDGHVVIVDDRKGELSVSDMAGGGSTVLLQGVRAGSAMALTASIRQPVVAFGNGENRRAELWHVDQRRRIATLEGGPGEDFCSLALDPQCLRLFSGSLNGVVKVWNVQSGEELISFKAHDGFIRSLALSPDGRTLATAGSDGLIKLWETVRLSMELVKKRRIVSEAANAVNRYYRTSPSLRDVLASLSRDDSLDKNKLQVAIEIANARGDQSDDLSVNASNGPR